METPTLLFESLQLPSRVAHVCVGSFTAPEPQLLACKADHLELFQLQEDGALGAGRRYPLHKQIEACTCLPPVEGALQQVLLVADDGQARVCAFRDGRLQQLSSVSLDAPPGKASSAPSRRLQGACLSQPVPLPAGGFAVVAALFHRHLHVLRVSAGGRQISARCANLSTTGGSLSLDDLDSAGLMSNQETLHIQALEFLDAGSPGGSSGSGGVSSHTRLLAVLSVHDFSPLSRDTVVDTVALNLSTLVLTTGPWCCRQMHPTTGALRALPAGSALGAGKGPAVLAFSGCGVTAVVTPQPSAASLVHGQGGGGGGGASAPQADCVRLLSHRLRGSPTCVEQLRPDVYVVGTDGAALYLVGLAVDSSSSQEMPPPAGEQQQQQQAWVQELALSGGAQPSVPSSLALLPAPPSAAAAAGVGALLAIGSTDGNSLLVAVPPALQADAAGAQPFVTAQVARDNSTWEVVEPSFVKNFAPVHSVAALPDKHAADDDAVLVACGTAPDGRLASCKVGAALLPYTTDGPELSGSVNLFALCAPDGGGAAAADAAGRHTHLVFSFEALGRTDVMLVSSNDAMAQVELPGLRQNVASLLVANLEGDTAVQVTRSVVLALGLGAADAGGARSQWAPPGAPQEAITMGACRDGFVAVATSGSKVYCLAAGGGSSLAVVASGPAGGGQVAALALCRLGHLLDTQAAPPVLPPSASGAVPADLVVLVGEWMTNRVVAMRAADLAAPPLLVLDLGGETPRSFHLVPPPLSSPPSSSSSSPSTAPAPAAATLLIGTNGGSLLSGSVAAGGSTGGALQLQLRGLQQAKISHVAVQLQPLGGEQAQWVYAHSGSDAIVRVLPPTSAAAAGSSTSSSNTAQVEVVRVHGSPDCRAVVALDTPGMPESMAWVTSAGRLCFGRLDPSVRLRCSTAHVLDTPQHVAYHEPSGCAALLSSDEGGAQWLRLVHGGSLQQVVAMKLAPGHFYNSLAVLPLPCTSSQQHEGDKEGRQPSCKPFIVLSSYLLYADTLAPLPPTAPSPQQQGLYQMQGLLSFFDAAVEHPPNGQVSRYSLRLLGTCPIPGVAMSLATAQPEAAGPLPVSDAAPSGGTSTAAAALTATPASAAELARLLPCLVVGCNDGVRVYSAYVDDAGIEGQRAVAAALDGLSRPGPLPGSTISPATAAAQMEVDTPAAARPQPGAAAAAAALGAGAEATAEAAQSLEALALRDWSQQVELRELCSCVPAAAASCVTSLGSCGPVVFASEFMASVSTFKLVFNRQGHALVPLSADKHGIWAQAALPLSERTVLAAVHPAGLALLGRDTAAEDACIAVAAREAVAAHEAGRHRQMAVAANVNTAAGDAPAGGAAAGGRGAAGAAQRPDVHQALELSAASAPDMVAVGAANIGHSVYCMCLGRWGLAMRPWERTTARLSDAGAAQAARHSTLPQSALLFATSGAVAVVRQVGDDVSARELRQLQAAVDKLPSDALARLAEEDAAAASSSSCCCSHAAGESWRLRLPVSSSLPADSTAAVDDACTSGPLGAFVNGDVIRALLHRADPSPVGGGIASQSAQQNDCAVRQLAALMGAASSEVLAERLHHALSV